MKNYGWFPGYLVIYLHSDLYKIDEDTMMSDIAFQFTMSEPWEQ
jgi:hypothetical protein